MVDKLKLPFPLLSDPDAAVIAAWDVYDPVGGTHGPIARPAIFVVGRDLSIPFEYVGRDFADRPPNSAIYAALEAVREASPRALTKAVSGPGPRPLGAGNPADKPMPLEEMRPYFRGATFGVQAISGRTDDPKVKAEADRFREIVADYVKAAIDTHRMTRPS
jgi:hypothetical protein